MLSKASEQIAFCHQRASECREKAAKASSQATSEEYRDLESLWLLLARSHELTERTTDFIREVDRPRDPSPVWKGWQRIADAPFDRDLEVAVIDSGGPHLLVFPCRRILGGWMDAQTNERVEVPRPIGGIGNETSAPVNHCGH